MRALSLFLLLPFCTTTLSAQVTTMGTTKKVIGITARSGTNSSYRSVAANTPIPGFFALRASSAGSSGSTSISNLISGGKVRIFIGENGKAQSLSSTSSAEVRTSKGPSFPTQPHVFAFTLKSPGVVLGKLTISIDGNGTKGAAAFFSAKIGSTTFSWALGKPKVQITIPVAIRGAGLRITTTFFAQILVQGKGTASYGTQASFVFERNSQPTCKLLPYGRSCAQLAGKAQKKLNGTLLTLSTSGSLLKALGFTVAGLRQIKVPFPGSPCLLLTNIVVLSGPFATTATGTATHNILIPLSFKGSFNLQDLVFRPGPTLAISSTNGLAVVCR